MSELIDPMDELKSHLKRNKQIERIYFNENGEWLFQKHPSFPIEKSRDQVLADKFDLNEKELDVASAKIPAVADTVIEAYQNRNAALPVYDITKKYSPKQMAAYIDGAVSEDELNLFVREDNKPETAELIKQKQASFAK